MRRIGRRLGFSLLLLFLLLGQAAAAGPASSAIAGGALPSAVGEAGASAPVPRRAAALKGRVARRDGAEVAGTRLQLLSVSRAVKITIVVSDPSGSFVFEGLPPARDYVLRVDSRGFAPMDVGPMVLEPGETTTQDVTLPTPEELGSDGADRAALSLPETVATEISGTFDADLIRGLPLVGRSFTDVLTLAPGVTDIDDDGAPNVQGARETGLQYRLDGADITDPVGEGNALPLNLEALQMVDVDAWAVGAAYGRFDGGLAQVRSRSGGDDFEGSFRLFWRGDMLDGDGTEEPSDTFHGATPVRRDFNDLDAYLSAGGPIVRGRLWYFAALQRFDEEHHDAVPGETFARAQRGWANLAKITWQPAEDHRLALTYAGGPREIEGLFRGFGVSRESEGTWDQHGRLLQARWTWSSRRFALDTQATWLDAGVDVTPVSDLFHPNHIQTVVTPGGGAATIQALYPMRECSEGGDPNRFVPNCDPALGEISISHVDLVTGLTSGPLSFRTDDSRTRGAVRADLGASLEGAGRHDLLFGLEARREEFENDALYNPILVDGTVPCPWCRDPLGNPIPKAVQGNQTLFVPVPAEPEIRAEGTSSSFWLSDSWRVSSRTVIQAGVRLDRDRLTADGFTPFDPRAERRRFTSIVDGLCAEALRIELTTGLSNYGNTCDPRVGYIRGFPPLGNLIFQMDAGTPASIRKYDVDHDGQFDSGLDGEVWDEAYTTFPDRRPETFHITNTDLSPRLGVSWDPWFGDPAKAGRTKLFATWGRYRDRLFLAPVAYEAEPAMMNFTFDPDRARHQFTPGQTSRAAPAPSVTQVDRGLSTPRTDVFTVGAYQDLGRRWTVGVTYTQRQVQGLLQDSDLNHITCRQSDEVLGLDPAQICPLWVDPNGKVTLGDDLFGNLSWRGPNGVTDIYSVNPYFNQVLRIGNLDDATYRSLTLEFRRSLEAGWQVQGSYTYSRAHGDGETYASMSRNDPALAGAEWAALGWDQRHRAVLVAAAILPKGVELGGQILWESGTPYSVEDVILDLDSGDNVNLRTTFPTGEKNDQRNGAYWGIDARVAKRFPLGRIQIAAEAAVRNLLDQDDLVLEAYQPSTASPAALVGGPEGLRHPGRAWQLGMTVYF